MKTLLKTLIAVAATMMIACGGAEADDVRVVRVDSLVMSLEPGDTAAMTRLLDSPADSAAVRAMLRVLGAYDPDWRTLEQWRSSAPVRVFQPDVDKVYPNIDAIRRELAVIDARALSDGLIGEPLTYATVVWGSERPVVRVGNVVLIALNHYLGRDYPGYAQFPPYRRADKRPEMLPYDVAAVIAATSRPMPDPDNATLEQWMRYEGSLVEWRMRLVPDAELYLALGYTPEQLEFVEQNYKQIIDEMMAMKLMGATDPQVIDRYIAPSPYTPLMQGRTPGRIGRYVGYRMIGEH